MRQAVFASPCCLLDPSSGAALASWRGLDLLAQSGFRCQAFCGTALDFREEVAVEQIPAEQAFPYQVDKAAVQYGPAVNMILGH